MISADGMHIERLVQHAYRGVAISSEYKRATPTSRGESSSTASSSGYADSMLRALVVPILLIGTDPLTPNHRRPSTMRSSKPQSLAIVEAMRTLVFGLAAWAGCSSDRLTRTDAPADTFVHDAAVDATPLRCDRTKPFQTPTPVAGVNTSGEEVSGWLSADSLRLYFTRSSGDPYTRDLYVAARPSVTEPFTPAAPITELNTGAIEQDPRLTSDELTIFFVRGIPGDILFATRPNIQSAFGTPTLVSELASSDYESGPWVTADGLTLYFCSSRSNGGNNFDLFRTTRPTLSAPFASPVALTELLTAAVEATPVVRDDGLEILFATNRDGVLGPNGVPNNIWHAVRPTAGAPFDTPVVVAELSESAANDGANWLSGDGCEVIFSSDRPGSAGGYDLWFATRPP